MELSIMNVIIVMLVCAMSAFLSHMGMAVFHDGIRPVIDHHAEVPEMPVHIADHRIKHQHLRSIPLVVNSGLESREVRTLLP